MNSQTHRFYISRMMLMFSTLLLGFLTASAVSAMNNADTNRNKVADFDGDGKSDISVFRPSNGFWHIMKSSGGFSSVQWGQRNDFLVPGDYDGDGRTDTAVYRRGTPPPPPANGSADNIWYVLKSSDNTSFARAVGKTSTYMPTDSDTNPAPADYDNDGRTDIAVSLSCGICRSPKTYLIFESSTGLQNEKKWGLSENMVVHADYDGDGKLDLAVFQGRYNMSSGSFDYIWFILQSSDGVAREVQFGDGGDKVVPADYDGDGKTDIAVYRPSNGFWYILGSRDGFRAEKFGVATDKPVPADYDGDGKTDIAVFRPSNGTWYLNKSKEGFAAHVFGFSDDIPIPNVYFGNHYNY